MCSKYNCPYIAAIVALVAGVVLGVLYALGFVVTGIIFWAYLGIGVAALLLGPVYATSVTCEGSCQCFGANRNVFLASAIGTVVTALAGLIVAPIASVTVVGIVLGLATFFVVWLLGTIVCLMNCLTKN